MHEGKRSKASELELCFGELSDLVDEERRLLSAYMVPLSLVHQLCRLPIDAKRYQICFLCLLLVGTGHVDVAGWLQSDRPN